MRVAPGNSPIAGGMVSYVAQNALTIFFLPRSSSTPRCQKENPSFFMFSLWCVWDGQPQEPPKKEGIVNPLLPFPFWMLQDITLPCHTMTDSWGNPTNQEGNILSALSEISHHVALFVSLSYPLPFRHHLREGGPYMRTELSTLSTPPTHHPNSQEQVLHYIYILVRN